VREAGSQGSADLDPKRLIARNDVTAQEAERESIIRALKTADGGRTQAAKRLGMSRRTLHRKLHQYHLEGF
jgi:transcriptional regulator of acetoin/glycerol metabolism